VNQCEINNATLTQVYIFNVAKCHIFVVVIVYILNTLCQYLHSLMLVSDVHKIFHGGFKLMLLNRRFSNFVKIPEYLPKLTHLNVWDIGDYQTAHSLLPLILWTTVKISGSRTYCILFNMVNTFTVFHTRMIQIATYRLVVCDHVEMIG
jgi:hypothetical protein